MPVRRCIALVAMLITSLVISSQCYAVCGIAQCASTVAKAVEHPPACHKHQPQHSQQSPKQQPCEHERSGFANLETGADLIKLAHAGIVWVLPEVSTNTPLVLAFTPQARSVDKPPSLFPGIDIYLKLSTFRI